MGRKSGSGRYRELSKEDLIAEIRRLRAPTTDERPSDLSVTALTWDSPEEFLDKIIDTIADPVFVKDEQHRWIAVNQAFCSLMGQPRGEIMGKSDFDYFPDEEARTFWEKDEEVLESGGVNINEEPLTDASGETHILVTKKAVFSDRRGRKILVGVIRDVTEQKDIEAELRSARDELEARVAERTREVEAAQAHLRQAQKMEAVGQLTGGIAHDFNNLLAVIVGNLELAMRRCASEHDVKEAIGGALAAADRGAALTHRLLAFSRRQALQPLPTDVNSLLADLLELIRRTIGETLQVRTILGAGVPPTLVDPVQLETALLNLAINARDAMPDGGELVIRTRLVRLDEVHVATRADLSAGDYVVIEVTDTGAGISPDRIERVFEPFFTTKDTGKGSGLGLSMVYGFVKQSRGHVTLSSTEGMGTTVEIYLPRYQGTAAPGTARHEEAVRGPALRRKVVLVVEDDPGFGDVAVSLVESLGHVARLARSAKEAMAWLDAKNDVDVVLSDVILPGGVNGPQLAAAIDHRFSGLPVLFMSGYTSDAIDPESQLDPEVTLLRKPFRRAELSRALDAVLQAEQALTS